MCKKKRIRLFFARAGLGVNRVVEIQGGDSFLLWKRTSSGILSLLRKIVNKGMRGPGTNREGAYPSCSSAKEGGET